MARLSITTVLRSFAVLLVAAGASSVSAQGQSLGWRVAGDGTYMRAAVGSDFSVGTYFTNGANGNQMTWTGPGSNGCVGDCASVIISGSTVTWQRDPFPTEPTYAGGSFTAAPILNLDAAGQTVATSHLNLWVELANFQGDFARRPFAQFMGAAQFNSGGQGKLPLHWRVDWSLTVPAGFSEETPPYLSIGFRVPGNGSSSIGDFVTIAANSSGSFSGVLGDPSYPNDNNENQRAGFFGSLGLSEEGASQGHGRAELTATIRFSRAEITTPVPEPDTMLLWAFGLACVAFARRRRQR